MEGDVNIWNVRRVEGGASLSGRLMLRTGERSPVSASHIVVRPTMEDFNSGYKAVSGRDAAAPHPITGVFEWGLRKESSNGVLRRSGCVTVTLAGAGVDAGFVDV